MHIFRTVVFAATLAGLLAGLLLTVLQQLGTVPLILEAEVLEQHRPVLNAHEHQPIAAVDVEGWAPRDGIERTAYTLLANAVTGTAFALLLVAGFTIRQREVHWWDGLLWGLGGFAVFAMAPSLGLPPELPGMSAAPLGARQLWWIATAFATAAALALLAFRRRPVWASFAVVLLVAPHLVGAPQPLAAEGDLPHELAHRFEVAVIMTNFFFWLALGGLSAHLVAVFTERRESTGAM